MSELNDLNTQGAGLAAVSGGLQGLLEAYKMKMAQQVQQAAINQQGFDAGAAARAQAQMMAAYHQQMADAATAQAEAALKNAGTNKFNATGISSPDPVVPTGTPVSLPLSGGSTSAAPSVSGASAPAPANALASSAFAGPMKDYISGNGPKPDMSKVVNKVLFQQMKGNATENSLDAAQAQKTYNNLPATISSQNAAKAMLDNLATMKSLGANLGLPDSPGPMGVGVAASYLKNSTEALVGGTAANKYQSMNLPAQEALAEMLAHRFNLGEMGITKGVFGFNNTHPSLNQNIDTMSARISAGAGIPDYVPQVLKFDANGNLIKSQYQTSADALMKSGGIPIESAAPAPGAPPAPAAPVAPVAASLMNAGGADLGGPPGGGANAPAGGAAPGKYTNLTMDQLQALKLTQMGQSSAVGQ